MKLLGVLIRTLFFYLFILISYRIMGKRQVGELSISDLSISILITELIAIGIEKKEESLIIIIAPAVLLVLLEVLFTYIELKLKNFRNLINGKPSVIIKDGKLNIKEMIHQRYTITDLLTQLRSNSITKISDVNYAILENNGNLSIFGKDTKCSPIPIIMDGIVDMETLLDHGKSRIWLENVLTQNKLNIEDILYGYLEKNKFYIIKK